MEKNILIIDDDYSLMRVLVKALSNKDFSIDTSRSISEAWLKVTKKKFDLIITDVMLPDGDGLELVEKVTKIHTESKIIVISAKNNLLTAIKSSKLGVFDYLPKPIDLNDLTISVNKSLTSRKKIIADEDFKDEKLPMVGTSVEMQKIYKTIAKLMKTNLTVLITGESGTGKELVAKAIHDFSTRSNNEFVVLNMAALPQNLIESELFGYEKGAFTGAEKRKIGYFEKAEGGTIFLDEIGDMPIEAQARLLRILQVGEFSRVGGREIIKTDVRIIAATNVKLKQSVAKGTFREDLFYRLNVVNIDMPPLRKRISDIMTLAEFFLKKFSKTKKFNFDCQKVLEAYKWPGNVRELENLIKKISLLYSEDIITQQTIEDELPKEEGVQKSSVYSSSLTNSISMHINNFFKALDKGSKDLDLYKNLLSEFERPLIQKTLDYCGGNQIKAANLLGINRNTLRKKIQHLKIKI